MLSKVLHGYLKASSLSQSIVELLKTNYTLLCTLHACILSITIVFNFYWRLKLEVYLFLFQNSYY